MTEFAFRAVKATVNPKKLTAVRRDLRIEPAPKWYKPTRKPKPAPKRLTKDQTRDRMISTIRGCRWYESFTVDQLRSLDDGLIERAYKHSREGKHAPPDGYLHSQMREAAGAREAAPRKTIFDPPDTYGLGKLGV